ncbi:hypothetical protein [Actinokineospora inagensis]|uniref:hypothetical protein n=1 Tax=Actinokineospora inagensis TaxID=103730 RepID=UPI00040CF4D4|nr:hypothetical protein [Actinokineospora inagensis]
MTEQPALPDRPAPTTDSTGAIQLGIVPLRPLTLPDLVSGTFQALRRNAGPLVWLALGLTAVAELVNELLQAVFIGSVPDLGALNQQRTLSADELVRYGGSLLITTLTFGAFGILLVAVANVVVPRAVFGHTTGTREAVRLALPALWRLLGVDLLVVLITALIAALALGLILVVGPVGALAALPLAAVLIHLSVAFSLAPSAAVVEGIGPADALVRSRDLVRAVGWWRLLGFTLLVGVVLAIVTAIVDALFGRISGHSVAGDMLSVAVGYALTVPVGNTMTSLFYVDYRARAEGIEGLWRKAG